MIPLISACLLFSCVSEKAVQMQVIEVQLVKVETVRRYPNVQKKLLTWRGADNMTYVTFEPVGANYQVGLLRQVMVKK